MTTTEALCQFLVKTKFEDMPEEAVKAAKDLILDYIGAALAGQKTKVGKIITGYVKKKACASEATVIGSGFKTSASDAAFCNATLAHALEFEAVAAVGGPNPTQAIGAGLCLAEKSRASGKRLLESFVLGYEIQSRVATSTPGGSKRGLIQLYGTLGAALTGTKILGLNLEQAISAFGIACSSACGLIRTVGTMIHTHDFGIAARGGVEAAELGKENITVDKNILEGPGGFCDAFFGEGGYDLAQITKDLGNSYFIFNPGVSIKKYPCCYRMHPALDAIIDLMDKHKISYGDVTTVEVGLNKYNMGIIGMHPQPKTGDEARFSIEQCIGAAVLEREVGLGAVADEKLNDSKYIEARGKVKVVFHPEWPPVREGVPTTIIMKLRDGREYTKEVLRTRNSTHDELLKRTRECAGVSLSPKKIDELIDCVLSLEKIKDVGQVMELIKV